MTAQTTRKPQVIHIPANTRGSTRIGWLDAKHSFSFGGYHDPARMGYHGLRVLNDDRIAAAQGFGTHPHRDMEILTWVLDGQLTHKDSMGHHSTLGTETAQLMSAGSGVTHSEFNDSPDAPIHLLQIWIMPTKRGTTPRYQEQPYPASARPGQLTAIATPDGRDGSLTIAADAEIHVVDLTQGQAVTHTLPADRVAYVHVATGSATINTQPATEGDAVTIEGSDEVTISSDSQGQVMLFVLPA